jgi:hypothetical protein
VSNPQPNPPGQQYLLEPIACRHREESHRVILRAADMVPQKRAVVLGGGPCEEIPLVALLQQFDEVLLNDLDESPVKRAIDALPKDTGLRGKVSVSIADLTGATADALSRVDQTLLESDTPASAATAIARALDAVRPEPFPIAGRYDLVVCSCVLVQLHVALTSGTAERFAARFPGQADVLAESTDWQSALARLARRMEERFVDDLANLVTDTGLVYLSESVQVCFLQLAPDGRWQTPGTYRMTRTTDLADYVAARFEVIGRARWEWVVDAPQTATDSGRLFDVQALVLRPLAHAAGQP